MKIKKCCVRFFPLQLLHLSSLLNKLGNASLYVCHITYSIHISNEYIRVFLTLWHLGGFGDFCKKIA